MRVTDLLLVAALVVAPVIWITALIDVLSHQGPAFEAQGRTRGGSFLLILVTGAVGGTYYWLVIHRGVKQSDTELTEPANQPSG